MSLEPQAALPSLFFGRTYEEARLLLQETRDYLAEAAAGGADGLAADRKLHFAMESSRLTARLVNLMAWLLLQRAAQAGELSERSALTEAPDLNRRAGILACPSAEALPGPMQDLLERSRRLYVRVARLDEMARRNVGIAGND